MGRRAKRPSPETALRMRINVCPAPLRTSLPTSVEGKIRMKRTDAATEWALKVFVPKHGYLPSPDELCAAVDSGVIGRWIEKVSKPRVLKKEIFVNGKKIDRAKFLAPVEKRRDMRFANEMASLKRSQREERWTAESQREAIAAAICGDLGQVTVEVIENEAKRLYAHKVNAYKLDQLFS